MGKDGSRTVVVNSLGREIRNPPTTSIRLRAARLQLTIDYDFQRPPRTASARSGFNGARRRSTHARANCCADEPPLYNPNDLPPVSSARPGPSSSPISCGRCRIGWIQGRYSPGSTFKIFVAMAGLEEGMVTPDFKVYCPGGATFYGRYLTCHLKTGHGSSTCGTRSSNRQRPFYTLAMLGVDRIAKCANRLGLVGKSGIDLPSEIEGIIPSTVADEQRYNEKWYAGETISVAIGQGHVSVTPIHGHDDLSRRERRDPGRPTYGRAATTARLEDVPPPPPAVQFDFKAPTASALHDGLWIVVNAAGTGGRGQARGPRCLGKNGHRTSHLEYREKGGGGPRANSSRPARPRMVCFLRAARQPRDRRRGLRRARRARLSPRPNREAYDRQLFREEGGEPLPVFARARHPRAAAAGRAAGWGAGRGAASEGNGRRAGRRTVGPFIGGGCGGGGVSTAASSSLRLAAAVTLLVLCAMGIATIYSVTWRDPPAVLDAGLRARSRADRALVTVSIDYRSLATSPTVSTSALVCCASCCWRRPRRSAPLDSARRRQPAALGVRKVRWPWGWPCSSATAGGRADRRRSPDGRRAPGCRSCSSPSSPTSAPRSRCCRSSLASRSSPGCRCADSGLSRWPACWWPDRVEFRAAGLPEVSASLRSSTPSRMPRGAGYQQIQAKISVGSGGLWGKGFRQGTQGAAFLPVAHNDFIFSVLAEEQGFLGVLVVLGAGFVRDPAR